MIGVRCLTRDLEREKPVVKPRAFPLLGGFFFGDHHGSSTGTDDGGNEGAVCVIWYNQSPLNNMFGAVSSLSWHSLPFAVLCNGLPYVLELS